MSKDHLTAGEVTQIINRYLEAVEKKHGPRARDCTDLSYRKGRFYLRPHTHSREAQALPYRAKEIVAMTRGLTET